MTAEVWMVADDAEAAYARAGAVLRAGGLAAFPTETVYGLAARGDDHAVLARLAALKGRDAGKPIAWLVASRADADRFAALLAPLARQLADAFWPGPLTLVVDDGRGGAIGLRAPDHPVALGVLRAAGVPVAATSANLAGEPPLRTRAEIEARFGDHLDIIIDGPPPPAGIASTVVAVTGETWRILRPGALSQKQIQAALA